MNSINRDPPTEDSLQYEERKQKILTRMHKLHLDKLVIYGDVEHGSNFEYLVGFLYRDVYEQEVKEMAKLYKKTIK